MISHEYEIQALQFLKGCGVKFFCARRENPKCALWCDGLHKHGDEFRITLSRIGKRWTFSFWNSLAAKIDGKEPTPYEVLACLTKNDPGSFEDFCNEFGVSTDSRKELATYRAVVREYRKLVEFFFEPEVNALQEIQ